jgi:hypothetical protein
VDYDKAGTFHRISKEKGAGLIGNLMPDPLHRVRLVQVDFRPSGQIHDKAQALIGKHPMDNRVFLDLGDLSARGGGQSIQVWKIIERHRGHPARLRESALIDRAEYSRIAACSNSLAMRMI